MIGKSNQEVMGDAATLAAVLENDRQVMEYRMSLSQGYSTGSNGAQPKPTAKVSDHT
jgi:hypothetical protein